MTRSVRMTEPFAIKSETSEIVYSPARAANWQAFASGGAGMVGTIDDSLKLLEAIRTGGAPILKKETARLIVENAIDTININALSAPNGG